MFVPQDTGEQARQAVAEAVCYAQALRKLGLRPVGGNHRLFRKYVDEMWPVPTDRFAPIRTRGLRRTPPT